MIDTLDALPALTRSWIASLETADPELYAELADSLVVTAPGTPASFECPAGVADVLAALDLSGKEIGAFRFAPVGSGRAEDDIRAYDTRLRLQFDAPPEIVFLGDYGSGSLFAAPQGIGFLDVERDDTIILAADFATFLLVQANAYDAYKQHIVKARDQAPYDARCQQVAEHPRFAGTDTAAMFAIQLRG